jgi:hypothetical protein
MDFRLYSITLASLIYLTACGGSGSSTPNEVPPPPTIANRAPILDIKFTSPVFSEGFIDFYLADSVDPDGSIREFNVEQISGPVATLNAVPGMINFGLWWWDAPKIDGDGVETVSFRISATDDLGAITSRNVSIQIEGSSQPGKLVARYDRLPNLLLGNGRSIGSKREPDNVIASFRIGDSSSQLEELAMLGGPYRQGVQRMNFQSAKVGLANAQFGNISRLKYYELSLAITPAFDTEFTVFNEQENKLTWVVSEDGNNRDESNNIIWAKLATLDVDSPCELITNFGPVGPLWVGQRGKGMTAFDVERIAVSTIANDFIVTNTTHLNVNKSLCFLHRAFIPNDLQDTSISDSEGIEGGALTKEGIVGLDFETNEIVIISTQVNEQELYEYDVLKTVPLNVPANEPLKIVEAIGFGSMSLTPNFMIVVLAGETNESNHYLINIPLDTKSTEGLGYDKVEAQTVYQWTGGIPIGVARGNFGGLDAGNQFFEDLAVVTKGGFGLHFDLINNTLVEGQPVFGYPLRFEVAPNATSMVRRGRDDSVKEDVLASHANDNTLRLYEID